MTQYKTLNVKLSNLQRNKLKSGIKNGTENFHHMLLVILMMKIFFPINCYELIHKFQSFVKLLQLVHQLI